ncbi:MAG: rhomboid family intramembrane serine protease [Planctomycetes bacterium]|nr:rhomboid family intramembrane serine protease [Planctomycetota bacterium]
MLIPANIRLRGLIWPSATIALILCNVLMFVGQQFMSPGFQVRLMLRPDRIDPIAWLTSMFMHADWIHLIGNMIFLWTFGMYLETRLGWQRLLVLYLLSGVGAGLTFLAIHWGGDVPSLGASGAIAGLMGLCVVAAPLGKLRLLPMHPALLILAALPGRRFEFVMPLIAWVGLWVFSQVMYAWAGIDGIAFAAHFGGIGLGILIGLAMRAKVVPEFEFEGPATEHEQQTQQRKRFMQTVASAWAMRTKKKEAPVDYHSPRKPNFDDALRRLDMPVAQSEIWDDGQD